MKEYINPKTYKYCGSYNFICPICKKKFSYRGNEMNLLNRNTRGETQHHKVKILSKSCATCIRIYKIQISGPGKKGRVWRQNVKNNN